MSADMVEGYGRWPDSGREVLLDLSGDHPPVISQSRFPVLFSVVIPVFNRRGLLRQALESVWAQTCTDFEVIVVDGGSTDGTRDDLAAAGERVITVLTGSVGPGSARNAGAAKASGRYIAFLDSDDLWFPWTLDAMRQVIEVHGSPALVAGRIHEFREVAELRHLSCQPISARSYPDFLAAAATPLLVGSGSIVVRRDVMQRSGGFTALHVNGEDQDFLLRLGAEPGFVEVQSPVTLAWRRHAGSATSTLSLSIEGASFLIAQERNGQYPGGGRRALERLTFIGRHVRSVSFACLRSRRISEGLKLYAATFRWHFTLRRFRYLMGFPLAVVARAAWLAPKSK